MPISYDFKKASGSATSKRSGLWKSLRFFGVLCVVAAITVGVIMIIVPDKKGKETGQNGTGNGNTEAGSGTTGNNEENKENKDNENNEDDISRRENKSEKRNTRNVENGDSSGKSDDKKRRSAKVSKRTDSTIAPKGKVSRDDLSEAEDQPVYGPGRAPGAAAVLTKTAAMTDTDKVIGELTGFLMKEFSAGGEFSDNWNAVGSELTAAVRKKWQEKDWKTQGRIHKVVARDSFIRIARRYHTTMEGLKFVNNRKGNMIRIGDNLNVIPGPWRITVSKKARLLNVWRKNKEAWQIFAVFPIGVGRKDSTPEGSFVINHRLRHPKWHGPDGRIFAYGDKENPLGDYFLKLRMRAKGKGGKRGGYGIHGSTDSSSVGRSLSNGCIRMRNSDVEILYYLLPVMTPVEIKD